MFTDSYDFYLRSGTHNLKLRFEDSDALEI